MTANGWKFAKFANEPNSLFNHLIQIYVFPFSFPNLPANFANLLLYTIFFFKKIKYLNIQSYLLFVNYCPILFCFGLAKLKIKYWGKTVKTSFLRQHSENFKLNNEFHFYRKLCITNTAWRCWQNAKHQTEYIYLIFKCKH